MKVFKDSEGTVINIGEWDYKLVPIANPKKCTPLEAAELKAIGRDVTHVYDKEPEYNSEGKFVKDEGLVVMQITNPLPEGTIEEEQDVTIKDSGARYLSSDYANLREYPSLADQLDYIYHNGVEAWKSDMIKPVKDKYPKV